MSLMKPQSASLRGFDILMLVLGAGVCIGSYVFIEFFLCADGACNELSATLFWARFSEFYFIQGVGMLLVGFFLYRWPDIPALFVNAIVIVCLLAVLNNGLMVFAIQRELTALIQV